MTPTLTPLSEMMKEMSERLLRTPECVPSWAAMHMALFCASTAWNESVGLKYEREGHRHVWGEFESQNPQLWNELRSNNVDNMIDQLVSYKNNRYPQDGRRILICGIIDGRIRVESLPATAPGVDAKWETRLYGLVRVGKRQQAIRFLEDTRNVSRPTARQIIDQISVQLGIV